MFLFWYSSTHWIITYPYLSYFLISFFNPFISFLIYFFDTLFDILESFASGRWCSLDQLLSEVVSSSVTTCAVFQEQRPPILHPQEVEHPLLRACTARTPTSHLERPGGTASPCWTRPASDPTTPFIQYRSQKKNYSSFKLAMSSFTKISSWYAGLLFYQ